MEFCESLLHKSMNDRHSKMISTPLDTTDPKNDRNLYFVRQLTNRCLELHTEIGKLPIYRIYRRFSVNGKLPLPKLPKTEKSVNYRYRNYRPSVVGKLPPMSERFWSVNWRDMNCTWHWYNDWVAVWCVLRTQYDAVVVVGHLMRDKQLIICCSWSVHFKSGTWDTVLCVCTKVQVN